MKKNIRFTLIIFILIMLFTYPVFSFEITQNEAIEDLDHLYNRIEEVHPNIYFHQSEEKAQNKISKIKDELKTKEKWSDIELYRLFSPFVASFKDGHTGLLIWGQFNQFYNNGGQIFPFDIKIIDDEVLIYKNYTDNKINKGTKLLAINDISIDDIINTFRNSISSENVGFSNAKIERNFPIYLWIHYNFKNNSYNIKLKDNIKSYQLEVIGVSQDQRTKNSEENERENWSLDFPIEGTAYLTINTFDGSLIDEFKKDIDLYFEEINNKNIEGLFIDISENGGGNTDLAKYLFEYIYDKPYNLFKEVRIKHSKYAAKQSFDFLTNAYYNLRKNEDGLVIFKSDKSKPKELENRFDGNVYVVVSNYTFSTAVDFAAMVKDHDARVIMGENTGGLPSTYGDIIRDKLPNSKLGLGISYKYFLRPAGFDNGKPLLVDEKIDVNELKYWYNDSRYKNMIIKSIIYKRRCSA